MKQELMELQKAILTDTMKGKDVPHWIAAIQTECLSFKQIEEACELLSGEFHMNGIDENFEPNDFGREVEVLIDMVNPTREFVIPGGNAVPNGSVLFKLGPNGAWIPMRKF